MPVRSRILSGAGAIALALARMLTLAGPATADHCGAVALVSPAAGPPGTIFHVSPRLGQGTIVDFYRAGSRVATVSVPGPEPLVASFRADASGQWLAKAHLLTSPACTSQVAFLVSAGLPATDAAQTIEAPRGPGPLGLALLIGALGAVGFGRFLAARSGVSRPVS